MGREWTEFDADAAEYICESLAEGKSLLTICADDELPSRTTVYRWLAENMDFANNYARAREGQGDYFAEKIFDEIEAVTDAAIARVKIDSLKWLAGRLNHKQWGDKKTLAGDSENPLSLPERVVVEIVKPGSHA